MTPNEKEKPIIAKLPFENYGPGTPAAKELHACFELCWNRFQAFACGDQVIESNMKLALAIRLCADVALALKAEAREQFLKDLSATHVEAVKRDMKNIMEWVKRVEASYREQERAG